MSRIIAFGCSQTYGHGLPDCTDPTQDKPSKFAWPNLLDSKCINYAEPGGSNKLIVQRAIEHDWQPDDIAVFAWTYIHRSTVFGKRNINLGTWSSPERSVQTWKHFVATANSKENFCFDSMVYVNYMKLFIPVPNYHFTVDTDLFEYGDFLGYLDKLQVDTAEDGSHYGPETHKNIARFINQAIDSN
jgi:hypothetical protein